ncbi:MAG: hypothetical protein ACI93S_000934, partial [Ancylomarina sp.]
HTSFEKLNKSKLFLSFVKINQNSYNLLGFSVVQNQVFHENYHRVEEVKKNKYTCTQI